MGLSFLLKKPWHPARIQNQEKVWKREQEAAAEQKLEDLRAQYEEERKNEEYLGLARSAGHGAKWVQLDFWACAPGWCSEMSLHGAHAWP